MLRTGWNSRVAFVQRLKPKTVLKTGMAHGVRSRCILETTERNGDGHLWSIELHLCRGIGASRLARAISLTVNARRDVKRRPPIRRIFRKQPCQTDEMLYDQERSVLRIKSRSGEIRKNIVQKYGPPHRVRPFLYRNGPAINRNQREGYTDG